MLHWFAKCLRSHLWFLIVGISDYPFVEVITRRCSCFFDIQCGKLSLRCWWFVRGANGNSDKFHGKSLSFSYSSLLINRTADIPDSSFNHSLENLLLRCSFCYHWRSPWSYYDRHCLPVGPSPGAATADVLDWHLVCPRSLLYVEYIY